MLKHIAEPMPTRTVGPGTLEPSDWEGGIGFICVGNCGVLHHLNILLVHDRVRHHVKHRRSYAPVKPLPHCLDCGREIRTPDHERCISCGRKWSFAKALALRSGEE